MITGVLVLVLGFLAICIIAALGQWAGANKQLLISSSIDKVKKFVTTRGIAGAEQRNRAVLTLYSANWCGACKYFKPTWNALKEKYSHENSRIKFKEVDCSDTTIATKVRSETILKNGEQIDGYPTMTITIHNGDDIDKETKFAALGNNVDQLSEKIERLLD